MAALGWLLNLDFAASENPTQCYLLQEVDATSRFLLENEPYALLLQFCDPSAGGGGGPAAAIFLESVCDGQSVNIDGSVREDRFSVGSEGLRYRRQIN